MCGPPDWFELGLFDIRTFVVSSDVAQGVGLNALHDSVMESISRPTVLIFDLRRIEFLGSNFAGLLAQLQHTLWMDGLRQPGWIFPDARTAFEAALNHQVRSPVNVTDAHPSMGEVLTIPTLIGQRFRWWASSPSHP